MYHDKRYLVAGMIFIHAVLLLTVSSSVAEDGSNSADENAVVEKPVPWHVADAQFRVPVTAAINDALLRMPPQVYLADLKPTETTGGLVFDPLNKSTILRSPQTSATNAQPNGTATYQLKPEYRWFCWRSKNAKVYIDGELVPDEDIHTWRKAGYRPREEVGFARLIAIPPGAKTLKIERVAEHIYQTGFITKPPQTAQALLNLIGHDPSKLVPIVYRTSGERVGCRLVWAEKLKPMSILFDCSSGDRDYLVYLVDPAKSPSRLDWTPKAGIVEELRYIERYDPVLETLDGFQRMWDAADVAGRGVPAGIRHCSVGLPKPARVIYRGHVPFAPTRTEWLKYTELLDSQPPSLSRIVGHFHIPATGSYRFLCSAGPGGHLLFDGQPITKFRGYGRGAMRLFDIKMEKGPHRLDILQYGPSGRVGWAALWWKHPIRKEDGNYHTDWLKFGETNSNDHLRHRPYVVWEPMADTETAPLEKRNDELFASFSSNQYGNLMGGYPSHDLVWRHFTAHVPDCPEEAVYRWTFENGLAVEGREAIHLFLSPGKKKVKLDVFDCPGGKRIAGTEGEIHVQLREPTNLTHMLHMPDLLLMIWDCGEDEVLEHLTIDELASLYYWSYPVMPWYSVQRLHANHHRVRKTWARKRFAEALALRVDEMLDIYPYSQLLQTAQGLGNPEHGPTPAKYAAAEKLYKVVLQRAPEGSSHWRTAAFELANIYMSVRGKPEEAYELLAKLEATEPAIDLANRWEMARPRQYHCINGKDKLGQLAEGLEWSPVERPLDSYYRKGIVIRYENNLALWIANQFDVPAQWNGERLIYRVRRHIDLPWSNDKYVWINGEPLGRMWQWPDGNIIIPAKFLKKGQANRITWLLQLSPRGHGYDTGWATAVFSADLKQRAWAVQDRVRYMKDGKRHDSGELFMLGALQNTPRSLAITRDGTRYASGHQYGEVKLWDSETGETRHSLSVGAQAVVALEYSPDGKLLAVGSENSRIVLLDAASGKMVRSLTGHDSEVLSLAFSPDGKRLASSGADKSVKIWNVADGREILTRTQHAGPVRAVAFSPDGKQVASALDKTRIAIWDAAGGSKSTALKHEPFDVVSLAFSPDGKRLAAGSFDKLVNLWDLETGKSIPLVPRENSPNDHNGPVRGVQFTVDGKQLLSIGGSIGKFWNTETGAEQSEMGGLEGYTRVPEGRWLGRHKMAEGFEQYPVALFTGKDCKENGLNYACYEGKWENLPDFDKLEPVKAGKLKHFDNEHIQKILLQWRLITNEGRVRWDIEPSGLRLSGYLKVEKAGEYEFGLRSGDGSRLYVGSTLVVDNDGVKNHDARHQEVVGKAQLEPGLHPIRIDYFHVDPQRHLNIRFPEQFVRGLAVTEVEHKSALGKAIWLRGEKAEGERILMNLERGGWPLDDTAHWQLSGAIKSIRSWARRAHHNDDNLAGAFEAIADWEARHPMLALTPDFLSTKIEAVIAAGDYDRGLALAEQLSQFEFSKRQEQQVLLKRVKWSTKAGKMDVARTVYQKLKRMAPTSTATAEAREVIKEAVLKQFDNE